ncbi:MAG: hypothetical protein HUU56_05200, partial [Bdellovibrionaceae bacterium]|nr:hypothetical protein [Pseudobdellovibrionaceae bacterium]
KNIIKKWNENNFQELLKKFLDFPEKNKNIFSIINQNGYEENDEISQIIEEKQKITNSPLTKQRLKQLSEAFAYNEKKMSEILNDFFPNLTNAQEIPKNIHDFYVPSQQTLALYLENIFRDFGDDTSSNENELSLEICKKLFKNLPQPIESMAVLGVGACRLALDLHLNLSIQKTLAIDFNPLLLMIALKMMSGKNLKLYEISSFPLSLDDVCRERILSYQHYKKISGFFPILADFQHLPLKNETLDVVLTPWIIDILPLSFNQVSAIINRVLKKGGFWINHGPLGFMHADPLEQLTSQEIKEKLSQNGFEVSEDFVEPLPYLQSEIKSQKRYEKTYNFVARKKSSIPEVATSLLPDWLCNRDLPIPLSSELKQQQIIAKTYADVFCSLNGTTSYNQLLELFSKHYKMPLDQADQTLLHLFTKFLDSQKRTLK